MSRDVFVATLSRWFCWLLIDKCYPFTTQDSRNNCFLGVKIAHTYMLVAEPSVLACDINIVTPVF